jgi:hypothetical protein
MVAVLVAEVVVVGRGEASLGRCDVQIEIGGQEFGTVAGEREQHGICQTEDEITPIFHRRCALDMAFIVVRDNPGERLQRRAANGL